MSRRAYSVNRRRGDCPQSWSGALLQMAKMEVRSQRPFAMFGRSTWVSSGSCVSLGRWSAGRGLGGLGDGGGVGGRRRSSASNPAPRWALSTPTVHRWSGDHLRTQRSWCSVHDFELPGGRAEAL
jgi:hypothetical protein